jgi:hydroxyacylglutathione hydrolase
MARLRAVADLRAAGQFTLPTTIAEEKATNPFLRATDAGIRRAMGLTDADADVVFGEMRARKNRFAA